MHPPPNAETPGEALPIAPHEAPGKAPRHLRASDARALAQLATQATVGVTGIVEGAHLAVLKTLGLPGSARPGQNARQTAGLTGLVYRSIDAVARGVGQGVDALLAGLLPPPEGHGADAAGTRAREAVLAALNGVMGDRLAASGNGLATPMSLRWRGQALNGRTAAELAARLASTPAPPSSASSSPSPPATGRLLLLIHGLCMNDLQWQTEHEGRPVDHGAALSQAGYTPIYLRYNTGRHISQNGRELAQLLESLLEPLLADGPLPVTELSVVAHSMGGLVIRSAVQIAREEGLRWPDKLKSIVFLGTPQHGAPLERAGNGLDALLAATPWSAPYARIGQLRSAGITDLRYGLLQDADWQGRDRFRRQPDSRVPLPLPAGVACYACAAATAAAPDSATGAAGRTRPGALASLLRHRLVGDGLVPLRSALGLHDDPALCLDFPAAQQAIAYGMHHLELLSRPEVTRQLLVWLAPQAQPHGGSGIAVAA